MQSEQAARPSVAVAIPAYNEEDGIGGFVTEINGALESHVSALYIVVGGRPHSAPASVLLGSVATAVVHHFQGSVLVVRSKDDSEWIASEHARDRWQRERAIDTIYGETFSSN